MAQPDISSNPDITALESRENPMIGTGQETRETALPESSAAARSTPDDQVISNYPASIRAQIEGNKKYPLAARRRGQEGEVGLRFILAANGDVRELGVRKSSGIDSLDRAAIDAVRRTTPFAKPPDGFIDSTLPMKLTIVFKLG